MHCLLNICQKIILKMYYIPYWYIYRQLNKDGTKNDSESVRKYSINAIPTISERRNSITPKPKPHPEICIYSQWLRTATLYAKRDLALRSNWIRDSSSQSCSRMESVYPCHTHTHTTINSRSQHLRRPAKPPSQRPPKSWLNIPTNDKKIYIHLYIYLYIWKREVKLNRTRRCANKQISYHPGKVVGSRVYVDRSVYGEAFDAECLAKSLVYSISRPSNEINLFRNGMLQGTNQFDEQHSLLFIDIY